MSWDNYNDTDLVDEATATEAESDQSEQVDSAASTDTEPEAKTKKKPKRARRRRRSGQAGPREVIEKYLEVSDLSDTELSTVAAVAGVKTTDAIDVVEAIAASTADTAVAERTAAIIDEITDSPVTAGMTIMGLERPDRNAIWRLLTALGQVDAELKGSEIETSKQLHETLSIAGAELRGQLSDAIEFIRA